MKRILLLALAWTLACSETAPAPPRPSPAPTPPPASPPRAPTPRPAVIDAGAPARAGPPRDVAGRVRDLLGYPVAGAAVTAGPDATLTDEGGAFLLRVPAATSRIEVAAAGYRGRALPAPRGGKRLRIVLTPVGTIGGAVRGVPHARVTLAGSGVWPPRHTHADGQGRYAFADVPEGVYELRARGEERVTRVRTGVAVEGPGGAATADLESSAAARLEGIVTSGGSPVRGARLVLSERRLSLLTHETVSGARGTFAFPAVAPGGYWLRAQAPGRAPTPPRRVDVRAPRTTMPLALGRGVTVAGRVLLPGGGAAAGARLQVQVHGPEGPTLLGARGPPSSARGNGGRPRPRFRADAQGRFLLRGLPPGRLAVLATHRRTGPGRSAAIEATEGETVRLSVHLTAPCRLVGQVLGDLGNPIDGARLVLLDPRGRWPRRVRYAGEGGRFDIGRLPPGAWRVVASSPGLLAAASTAHLRPDRPARVTLRLRRGDLVIAGLVADPEGNPLPGALITVRPQGGRGEPRSTRSDEVGHFRISPLAAGRYTLRAEHPAHPPLTLRGVDGSERLDLRLGGGGEIFGRVTSAGAAPPSGTRVSARRLRDPGEEGARVLVVQPVTSADGRFRLRGLPPGMYEVSAEAPGYETADGQRVDVGEADRMEVELRLGARVDAGLAP